MAGRQVRRRAFGLVGLFVLAGFRQQFAAFVLKPVVGDLDRACPRLQIAGFEDELGFSTPAVTGRLHWVQVGQGRASAADHPLTTRTRSAIRFIPRILTYSEVERSKRAGRTPVAPTEWTKVVALEIGQSQEQKLVRARVRL
jgi:hypothetical protein